MGIATSIEEAQRQEREYNLSSQPPSQSASHTTRQEPKLETCTVCEDEIPKSKLIPLVCHHYWCRPCLNQAVAVGYSSPVNHPPICCDSRAIDVATVQGCLDDDVLLRVTEVYEEYTSFNPIFCAELRCGKLIPQLPIDRKESQFVMCRSCRKRTCKRCRVLQGAHIDGCPDDDLSEEDQRLVSQAGWKRCPRCRVVVERVGGCRMMVCFCGTSFCYMCGGALMWRTRDSGGMQACYCNRGEISWCGRFCSTILLAVIIITITATLPMKTSQI